MSDPSAVLTLFHAGKTTVLSWPGHYPARMEPPGELAWREDPTQPFTLLKRMWLAQPVWLGGRYVPVWEYEE